MTTRTITVPTETEETVDVCDDCGLGDETPAKGDLVEFTPRKGANTGASDLHFHEACLGRMGQDGLSRRLIDAVDEAHSYDMDVWVVADTSDVWFGVFGVLVLVLAAFAIGAGAYWAGGVSVAAALGVLKHTYGHVRAQADTEVFA